MQPKPILSDRETLRRRARRDVDAGPVTESYRADSGQVVDMLNRALATELVCVLRYRRHYYASSSMTASTVRDEFMEHAREEQEHADQLAERITQLGGEPDFSPQALLEKSHAEYVPGRSLREMIYEDLVAERIAVDSYREMIQALGDTDPTTRRMLEDILATEEEHADEFAELLEREPRDPHPEPGEAAARAPRQQPVEAMADSGVGDIDAPQRRLK